MGQILNTFSSASYHDHPITSTLNQDSAIDDHLITSTLNQGLDASEKSPANIPDDPLITSALNKEDSVPGGHLITCTCTLNEGSDPLEQVLANVPGDLLFGILSWLPVKSLVRFKCVSQSWLSLISSSDFIKTHVRKNNEKMQHRVICRISDSMSGSDIKEFSLNSAFHAPVTLASNVDYPRRYNRIRSFEIVGSCNGLVCVTTPDHSYVLHGGDIGIQTINGVRGILLWNPSLKKCRKLPNFHTKSNRYNWEGWFMSYGYGYDESNDDYKVFGNLCVRYGGEKEIISKMYSRKTHSWKRIEGFKGGNPIHERGYFASGKLHWMATTRLEQFHTKQKLFSIDFPNETNEAGKIVSIDMENETCGVVEYPEYEMGTCYRTLGTVRGFLSLVCGYQSRIMDIWVMNEYGLRESWTRVVSVVYPIHIVNRIYGRPVFLSYNSEYLLQIEHLLVLYNSERDSIGYPHIENLGSILWVDTYVESLVLPYAFQPVQRHRNRKRKRNTRLSSAAY